LARTSLPVPPFPFSNTGTLVAQVLVANRLTCCIAEEHPKMTSSGGSKSIGSVPLFFRFFSPGMFVQSFCAWERCTTQAIGQSHSLAPQWMQRRNNLFIYNNLNEREAA